jgi:ribosome-associated heat shock protein Hsp15
MDQGTVRIDKWLWAVRIFKTRSLSAEACRSGKVTIKNIPVKASREVKLNDIIVIQQMPVVRTVKVLSLLHNRVSAKLAPLHMEDLTPASEYEKIEVRKAAAFVYRPRGTGRPTKKERRDMEGFEEEGG